jgi:arylsulfatase A-like enzyme
VQFFNGRLQADNCDDTTLAQVLGKAGYATGAFVSASVLGLRNLRPMARGFETYDDRMTRHESNRAAELRRLAADTNGAALAWIRDHRERPFFCWIHLMDAHGPYEAPEPHGGHFLDEVIGKPPWVLEAVRDGEIGGVPEYQILNVVLAPNGSVVDYERNYNYYAGRYDGGIRYLDACIGNLLGDLRGLGLYDDLLLVVTSDHGEALGENGVFFFHSLTVSMDQIRVPLIVRLPDRIRHGPSWPGGQRGSERIAVQVSTLDIAPTILDFLNLEGLKAQGTSLRPLMEGRAGGEFASRVVFSEIETQVSAVDHQRQVLLGRGVPPAKQFPFFHPAAPDSETVTVYRGGAATARDAERPLLETLAADFARRGRQAAALRPAVGTGSDDDQLLDRLKALGYVT